MNGRGKTNVFSLPAHLRRKEMKMKKTITLSWTAEQKEKSIHFDFEYSSLNRLIEVETTLCGETEIKHKSPYSVNSDEWLETAENENSTRMAIIASEVKSLKQLSRYDEVDPDVLRVANTLAEALQVPETYELPWMLPEDYLQNNPDDEDEEVVQENQVSYSNANELGNMRIHLGEDIILDLFLKNIGTEYLLGGYLSISSPKLRIYCFFRALEMNYHQKLTPWKEALIHDSIVDEMVGKCLVDGLPQDAEIIRKAALPIIYFLRASAPAAQGFNLANDYQAVYATTPRPIYSELDIAGQYGF